ncbi:ABC transporter substrate-binding protein [Streptomyces tubbatahanensis]|uniref:ABC transporter substrate-binding protein n=1 Tax=Streptomyces tubbatahanensis TaxID=2923272 RepID=A0ABY3XQG9_9ACTN|nr:ABC transporter substrate-binding protein [Streptomyces tubbatahanensis]UNS96650.1 ABC transporter substrate-binding protein [Streptomyces tubbatahanensis]
MRRTRRGALRAAVPALALTLLPAVAGCGTAPPPGTAADKAGQAGSPRTLHNCGHEVALKHRPQRAVSLDQGSTEILLALGLADRMAGTGTWTDPVMKGLEKENAKVERLADGYPAMEKVLSEEPDLVTASFSATLDKGGVAPREKFAGLGVPTYLSPADCAKKSGSNGDGARRAPLTMDTVYGEVRDLAKAFGVQERGERLVADLRARMRKATEGVDAHGTSVMYWFANSESPYVAGCCGAPGVITRAVGAENAFAGTHDEWPQVGWEAVADRDPDVIVLGDLTRENQTAETAKAKIEKLESDPVTRHMTAVRHKRYVLLPGAAMNPSIRTVEGVEKVARGLRDLHLTEHAK